MKNSNTVIRVSNGVSDELIPTSFFSFSGGERHVKFNVSGAAFRLKTAYDTPKTWTVSTKFKTPADFFDIALSIDTIRRAPAFNSKLDTIRLVIPYFPYARQDRVCVLGEALSVKVLADLINTLNVDSVIIFDPHSDVTPALINNVCVIHQDYIFSSIVSTVKPFGLDLSLNVPNFSVVSPDGGALKKIDKIGIKDTINLSKVRDVNTGAISGTAISSGNPKGKTCVIVDDICDGGRTFIEAAKVLRAAGAEKVYLYVTHGIFSKGFGSKEDSDTLRGTLDGIITTNSFYTKTEEDSDFVYTQNVVNEVEKA